MVAYSLLLGSGTRLVVDACLIIATSILADVLYSSMQEINADIIKLWTITILVLASIVLPSRLAVTFREVR
jgi:hypothetical protein